MYAEGTMDKRKVEPIMNSSIKLNAAIDLLGIGSEQSILVAVSGGMDSMSLLNACLESGLSVEVAHVNYGLRGEDSRLDEALVRNFCKKKGVRFHVSNWSRIESVNGSVQMQCRDHRYVFFEQVMDKYGIGRTLLGHHSDDNVETMLLNLFKGSGINGLTGIPAQRDRYYRPFLEITRAEIEQYVETNKIPFRHDTSNFESKYERNFLRNELLPLVENRLTGSTANIGRSIENLNSAKQLLDFIESTLKADYFSETETSISCNLTDLKAQPGYQYLLFNWLFPYGFSANQVKGILRQNTGTEFLSEKCRVIVSREMLYGEVSNPESEKKLEHFNLDSPPDGWSVSTFSKTASWIPSKVENIGEFDLDKVKSLHLRHWSDGDKFKPLGMKGWKKLSDFFVDEKLSIFEKEKVKLLVSENDIMWIVGMRIDERFKVGADTKTVLQLTCNSNN